MKIFSKIMLLAVFSILCFPLAAQICVDPGDQFYVYAEKWETEGLVEHLPQIRPYPAAVVKKILQTVIEKGDGQESATAAAYYKKLTGNAFNLSVEGGATYKGSIVNHKLSDDKQISGETAVSGDILFNKLLSMSYDLGVYGNNASTTDSDVTPQYQNNTRDTIEDSTSVGPLDFNIDMNSNVAFGTDKVYVAAGLNRSGFGPFLNSGIAINDTSFHSANMVFSYQGKKWSYTEMLASVGASLNNGTSTGQEYTGEKYFMFHAIKLNLLPKFDLTYYESCIYGKKFDASYVVPAPFMAIQGINGASDNVQMGLIGEYQFSKSAKFVTDVMVDDIAMDDIVKLNFDTKIRIAGQTGIVYAPKSSIWNLLLMNYTVVTPYTYSHWEYDDEYNKTFTSETYNYSSYTNHGICIGSSLYPNSDALSFSANFTPARNFSLTLTSLFARHGNEYESLTDDERTAIFDYNRDNGTVYSTDGSTSTQQMFTGGSHIDTAWDSLNFLTQDHIMYTCQMGFTGEYTFAHLRFGSVSLKAGYTFEYIHNKGVDEPLFTGSSEYSDAEDEYETWVSNLHDEFNNYISVSLKLVY
ncbi:MAG: hypothetical protein LKF96_00365 [Treponema sp.]|jgi:hypothetical protein|nr:hypothetical protein [Treponema sp.]